jgi:Mce-associated membrane protein
VLDGALTSLDQQNNTADIIVALQVTVTAAKGSPATKRERVEGTLSKTASGWKLSSLGLVPVGTT